MPIIRVLNPSSVLVIAATGFANKLNLPVADFFNESQLSDKSRIVIIDPTKRHTLGGLPPQCPSFFDFLNYLKQELARISSKRVIVTGTSAGAHTALLLGHILKADQVVAFSPYPYLSLEEMKKRRDPALQSMRRVIMELDQLPKDVKQFFLDLKAVLANWNQTRYYVHVSRFNLWDYRRAMYLDLLPHLPVISHPYFTHAVACSLARQDKLRKCFEFSNEEFS